MEIGYIDWKQFDHGRLLGGLVVVCIVDVSLPRAGSGLCLKSPFVQMNTWMPILSTRLMRVHFQLKEHALATKKRIA